MAGPARVRREVMAPGFGHAYRSTFNDITSAEMGRLLIALAALVILVLLGVIAAGPGGAAAALPAVRHGFCDRHRHLGDGDQQPAVRA